MRPIIKFDVPEDFDSGGEDTRTITITDTEIVEEAPVSDPLKASLGSLAPALAQLQPSEAPKPENALAPIKKRLRSLWSRAGEQAVLLYYRFYFLSRKRKRLVYLSTGMCALVATSATVLSRHYRGHSHTWAGTKTEVPKAKTAIPTHAIPGKVRVLAKNGVKLKARPKHPTKRTAKVKKSAKKKVARTKAHALKLARSKSAKERRISSRSSKTD